jgi:hypothetical protein
MDEYNILIICLTVICIFLIIFILKKKNKESFQILPPTTCGYVTDPGDNKSECLVKCFTYAQDNAASDEEKAVCRDPENESGCIKKCNNETKNICEIPNDNGDPFTQCIINPYMDISGNTIQQCIDNCKIQTENCKGCKDFHFVNQFDGLIAKGTYTNNLDHYLNRCSPEAIKQQFCSPCVKACKECSDSTLCRWLEPSDPKQHLDFLSENFIIGAIPADKSVTIVWNEGRTDVSNYLVFIYRKSEVNVDDENDQQTPLTIKTVERKFENTGDNHQIIDGLINGVTYSITVNKVSTNMDSVSGQKIVKPSNTIDIVPSKVTKVDFSRLKTEGYTQDDTIPNSFFDSIKGKTFDISI